MMEDYLARIEEEMRLLQRRCAPWLHDVPAARRLAARWTLSGFVLRWHVAMEDILEPDVDIEITAEGFVVRALPPLSHEPPLVGLLPVPPEFDAARPKIRFESGYLEVRVSLRPGKRKLR